MDEEKKKAAEQELINKLKEIKVCGDKKELYNYEAARLLYMLEGKNCVIETLAHNEDILIEGLKLKDKMIDLMADDMDKGIGYYTASKEEIIKLYREKVESEVTIWDEKRNTKML